MVGSHVCQNGGVGRKPFYRFQLKTAYFRYRNVGRRQFTDLFGQRNADIAESVSPLSRTVKNIGYHKRHGGFAVGTRDRYQFGIEKIRRMFGFPYYYSPFYRFAKFGFSDGNRRAEYDKVAFFRKGSVGYGGCVLPLSSKTYTSAPERSRRFTAASPLFASP